MRNISASNDTPAAKPDAARRIMPAVFLFLFFGTVSLLWRHDSFAESRFANAAGCGEQASGSSSGRTVTKEVPHSKESIQEIEKRTRQEPAVPRGDEALPAHRIVIGDNVTSPPGPDGGAQTNRTP